MRWRAIYPLLILVVTSPVFGQNHPVPYVSQPLSPASVAPGGPGFVLTVNGTGFAPGATVNWNGKSLPTSYVSDSRLAAHISRRQTLWPQSVTVTVTNPAPGGGTSNAWPFSVTEPTRSVAFARSTIAVGNAPVSVVTADFNNDGIPDLAVTNECGANASCPPSTEGTVSILLGNGDGTFRPAASLATHGDPVYAVAGDFNGDGKQDMVVASDPNCQGCAELTVFLGNGDGTFGAGRQLIPGLDGGFLGLVAADFNGDGHLDLAVSAVAGAPYNFMLLGNGDGTFTQTYLENITSVGALATADFNRDGMLDLASVAPLRSFMGKGDGTFSAPPAPMIQAQAAAPGFSAFQSMAVGDFNGDGMADVAYIDPTAQKLYVYRGNGDGSFTLGSSQTATTAAANVATADMNGDGKLDLVAVDSAGNVDVYLGYGDGTFAPPVVVSAGNAPAGPVAVGDFNRDGKLDIAVVNSEDGTVSILTQTAGYAAAVEAPISADGTSVFNAKLATLPVRFSLAQYGTATCELPLGAISVSRTAGKRTGVLGLLDYATLADWGPFFRMDRGTCQYAYDLAASRMGPGTYQATITLNGSVVGTAVFGIE